MTHVPGPDFPTGGVAVDASETIHDAYETGRGAVRVRARWEREDLGRGLWRVVVTEIPYQVQKGRLIEQLAELIEQKKAPLLGDVRDESTEEIRLVLEPKSRNVEPEVLMESLFKLSDLETRFNININVLDAKGTPGVMGLKACLQAFLDHRREVLVRRSTWRRDKVEKRLHVLEGLTIAFLNLDEVIKIIRTHEQPKAELIKRFGLTEVQADFILDTRLRQLARLEEMEIKREHAELTKERDALSGVIASTAKQWTRVGRDLAEVRKQLLSARRTTFAAAPDIADAAPLEAFVVREPVTVILSERGWIRATKGRVEDPSELKFKEGDKLAFLVPCETTDKLLIFASDGRFFTIPVDKLPPGRGHGEPLRLMVDFDEGASVVAVFAHTPGRKLMLASKAGYGFVMPEEEALAQKRGGRQVLNGEGVVCVPAEGDHVCVLGDNGKALIFPLAELPEMARGKGNKLQSYREGGLKDAMVFSANPGPEWVDGGGRRRQWPDWTEWLGKRAQAGHLGPRGMKKLRA
jgi:topoisomerase-4 subunit A